VESEVFDRLAEQESKHWWFRARRQILDSLIRRYAYRGDPLKILEAGCGTGGNLTMLSEFGEVHAFELDSDACKAARSKGFTVEEGALPAAHPFTTETFDLIVLFDVLEHVREDQESLDALAKLLNPGGVFLMTVPAFPFLWSGHDVQHHHFRRYRRPLLRKQLQTAGMEARKISYFNFWLFPVIAMVRGFKKLVGSKHSDEEGVPHKFINALLRLIFASERFLLSAVSFPFGVSLLAVCKRPNA